MKGGWDSSSAIGKVVNCTEASLKTCLQKTDAVKLTMHTYDFGWGPHTDKVTIPAEPMSLLQEGRINNFSVMMGALTNDSNKGLVEYPMRVPAYEARVAAIVGLSSLRHWDSIRL